MSETPRTDAAAGTPTENWERVAMDLFDCSQLLERELNAANARIRSLESALYTVDLHMAGMDHYEHSWINYPAEPAVSVKGYVIRALNEPR